MADVAPPPAAPAAPAAPASPNPSGPPPLANLASAFDALDKFAKPDNAPEAPVPPHPSQKKAEAPKPAVPPNPPEAPAKVDDDAPVAPPTEPPKPGETVKPLKPADFLRQEMNKAKAERDALKAEVEKLKAAPATESPELKTLTEKLAAESKARQALEDEMRFTHYERSGEYKDKYEAPFVSAFQAGRAKVTAFKVTDAATGEPRPGKPEDFDAIMAAPNDEAAAELIEQMFGPGSRAQIVTLQREKVLDLNTARAKAVDEFRKTGSEREKSLSEANGQIDRSLDQMWEAHIKPEAVPEAHKEYILPKDGDAAGNTMLAAGYANYDAVMKANPRDPSLNADQRKAIISKAAVMRHRAASQPRLVTWLKAAQTEIAKLKADLKAFEDSAPGSGEGKRNADGSPAAVGGSAMEQAEAALERRAIPTFH